MLKQQVWEETQGITKWRNPKQTLHFKTTQIEILNIPVFWDTTPCRQVYRYRHFWGASRYYLQVSPSRLLPWRWRQRAPQKRWYLYTNVNCVTSQHIGLVVSAGISVSNLAHWNFLLFCLRIFNHSLLPPLPSFLHFYSISCNLSFHTFLSAPFKHLPLSCFCMCLFIRFALRCVIPVVCVTKWEVGAYSRTTQLIRRKYVLFYYEKLHVSAYIGHHQDFFTD